MNDDPGNRPSFLQHDAYDTQYTARYLTSLGRHAELDRLLDHEAHIEGRLVNVWYWAHEQASQPAGFVRDVDLAWQHAERAAAASEHPSVARQIRYALMTACVTNIVQKVPPELIAELVRTRIWSTPQAIAHIAEIPGDETASRALLAVAEQATESDKDLVRDAAHRQLVSAAARLPLLATFLRSPVGVEGPSWREFLGTLQQCAEVWSTATAMKALSVRLDQDAMTDVTNVIDRLPSPDAQANLYRALIDGADDSAIPWLARGVRGRLEAANESGDDSYAVAELAHALCQRLITRGDLSRAFDIARGIPHSHRWIQTRAFAEILVATTRAPANRRQDWTSRPTWQLVAEYLSQAPAHHAVEIANGIESPSDAALLLTSLQDPDARAALSGALARGGDRLLALELAKGATTPDIRASALLKHAAFIRGRKRREVLQLAADAAWESESDVELLLQVSTALPSELLAEEALRLADQRLASGRMHIARYARLIDHLVDHRLKGRVVAGCLSTRQSSEHLSHEVLRTVAPHATRELLISALRLYQSPLQAEAEFNALTTIARLAPPELARKVAIDCLTYTVPRLESGDQMAAAFKDLVGYLDASGRLIATRLIFDLAETIAHAPPPANPQQDHHPAPRQAAEFKARALGSLAVTEPPGQTRDWIEAEALDALIAVGQDTGVFATTWAHVIPTVGRPLDHRTIGFFLSHADDVWTAQHTIPDLIDPFLHEYQAVYEWISTQELSALETALRYEDLRRRWLLDNGKQPPAFTDEVLVGINIGRSLLRRMPRWHTSLTSVESFLAMLATASIAKADSNVRKIAQRMAEDQAAEFRGRAYEVLLPQLVRLGHAHEAFEYIHRFVADTRGKSSRSLSIIAAVSSAEADCGGNDLAYAQLLKQAIDDIIAHRTLPDHDTEHSRKPASADEVKADVIAHGPPVLQASSAAEVLVDLASSIVDPSKRDAALADVAKNLGPAVDTSLWAQLVVSVRDVEDLARQVLKSRPQATIIRRLETLICESAIESESLWQLLAESYASNGLVTDVLRLLPKTPTDSRISILTTSGLQASKGTVPPSAVTEAVGYLQEGMSDLRTFRAVTALAQSLEPECMAPSVQQQLLSSFHHHLRQSRYAPHLVLALIGDPICAVSADDDVTAAFRCIQDMRRWWGEQVSTTRSFHQTDADREPLTALECQMITTFLQAQAAILDLAKTSTRR